MGTSERAFNQVKAILSKLDRSIEEARRKRLTGESPAPASGAENGPSVGAPARPRARPIPPRDLTGPGPATTGALMRPAT